MVGSRKRLVSCVCTELHCIVAQLKSNAAENISVPKVSFVFREDCTVPLKLYLHVYTNKDV